MFVGQPRAFFFLFNRFQLTASTHYLLQVCDQANFSNVCHNWLIQWKIRDICIQNTSLKPPLLITWVLGTALHYPPLDTGITLSNVISRVVVSPKENVSKHTSGPIPWMVTFPLSSNLWGFNRVTTTNIKDTCTNTVITSVDGGLIYQAYRRLWWAHYWCPHQMLHLLEFCYLFRELLQSQMTVAEEQLVVTYLHYLQSSWYWDYRWMQTSSSASSLSSYSSYKGSYTPERECMNILLMYKCYNESEWKAFIPRPTHMLGPARPSQTDWRSSEATPV